MSTQSSFKDSAVVVLLPSSEDASGIVVPEGEDVADLHVTLWYIPKAKSAPTVDQVDLEEVLAMIASVTTPLVGIVSGSRELGNDDPPATVLTLISPWVEAFRDSIKVAVPEIPPSDFPRFLPHVTVGYGVPLQPHRIGRRITFDKVALWWCGERETFSLEGI